MTISEMIEKLKEIQEKEGDIEVGVYDDCGLNDYNLWLTVVPVDEDGTQIFFEENMKYYHANALMIG